MFLSSNYSAVSHYSSIGTVALSPLTMFQLDNDTFAIINTQPSNMQGEHWIMIANFCQKLSFTDSLGRIKYSFLKQQYEQMMPEELQSHPSVCGFTRYMQLFICSNSDNKKLQEFTMLMYIHSEVNTCKFPIFLL